MPRSARGPGPGAHDVGRAIAPLLVEGQPALIATAPAILGAIGHATGVRIDRVPATPPRVLAAIRAGRR